LAGDLNLPQTSELSGSSEVSGPRLTPDGQKRALVFYQSSCIISHLSFDLKHITVDMTQPQPTFPDMTTSRDAPNPLRPYYVPPSIGLPPDAPANNASTAPRSSIGSSARDMFQGFDYGAPLFDGDSPSVAEMGKKILDQALWKYTSVLLAQPFDVAKTILQVRLAAVAADTEDSTRGSPRPKLSSFSPSRQSASESDSDQDEPSYFTQTAPSRHERRPSTHSRSRRRTPSSPSASSSRAPSSSSRHSHKLNLRRSDSIMEVIGQLWQHSGATGLWKATNATFIYNVLSKAIETWSRSLLSALMNLPDPAALSASPGDVVAGAIGGLDVADSPSPMLSLGIAVAAAAIAGVLLAPLDLVRTR